MIELVAFAPLHASATLLRTTAGATLRVLLGATFVTTSDAASLASDPEALDEADLSWLTRPDDIARDPECTAFASPWRVRLPRGELEVVRLFPMSLSRDDWEEAAIEVGDQWLPAPKLRPFLFVIVSGERRSVRPELCRVDFARWRDRLRTVWRYELTLTASESLDELHAGMTEDRDASPPSLGHTEPDRTAWREIKRFTVDERQPLEDTVSAIDVPSSVALPFVELPRQETVELHRPTSSSSTPIDPIGTSNADSTPRRTIGELLADGRPKPALFTSELHPSPSMPEPASVPRLSRIDVLWFEESAAKRARRQADLRASLPKIRWSGTGAEETQERHLRELTSMLRSTSTTSLDALASGDETDAASVLHVVAGDLEVEFDETAVLSATVAGAFSLRKDHPSVERVAAEGERVLAEASLDEAPFLAKSATDELLAAVRAAGQAEDALSRNVDGALVRRRRFATRVIEGTDVVRARLFRKSASTAGHVVYLRAGAAEKLPLLRRIQARLLVRVLPPQEEGDPENCLFVEVLARET